MNAVDTLDNIFHTCLYESDLKYCFVTADKHPLKTDGTPAKPNQENDFVSFDELVQSNNVENFAGVGISVQASKVCAIDVDHCFEQAFEVSSADERAKDILLRFSKYAYCEFSFSGTGLRVLFRHDLIENYSKVYYIKNSQQQIEYYEPSNSFRYVTLTGKVIANNPVQDLSDFTIVEDFLNDYMLRPVRLLKETFTEEVETKTFEQLMNKVKAKYLTNVQFQDAWFKQAPGSGKNESELDYAMIAFLYEQITRDKDLLKQIFEASPYFKSKDYKHISKWNAQDFRYFNYVFDRVQATHL